MKLKKVLIAAVVLLVFSMVYAGVTCGWLFSWVYKLEPTGVWKNMDGPPGLFFQLGNFLMLLILVVVYALLKNGIPGKTKVIKGVVFGLCVYGAGVFPGMFVTYYFMNVAAQVVIYWLISGLIDSVLKGMIIAAIYGD